MFILSGSTETNLPSTFAKGVLSKALPLGLVALAAILLASLVIAKVCLKFGCNIIAPPSCDATAPLGK